MKFNFGDYFINKNEVFKLKRGRGIGSKFALDFVGNYYSEKFIEDNGYFVWEMKSNYLIPVTRNQLTMGPYRKMSNKECAKFLLTQERGEGD